MLNGVLGAYVCEVRASKDESVSLSLLPTFASGLVALQVVSLFISFLVFCHRKGCRSVTYRSNAIQQGEFVLVMTSLVP
jgi:hypothetical protein